MSLSIRRERGDDTQMNGDDNVTLLLPSMMCADFGCLRDEVGALEAAGADGFHLDLMDGNYVPNYGMGLQDIEWICKNATIPCDVHMMAEDPGRYVGTFAAMGARIIYVHPEADVHVARTLSAIREAGARPGIAINPGTAVAVVEPVLSLVDYVLVMTVNPGFAGQKWLPFVDEKIALLAKMQGRYDYQIVVDGNCSPENVARAHGLGARGFVLGTAGLFGHGDYGTSMTGLRALAGNA